MSRANIKSHKRWVVKVGSAVLTNNGQGLSIKVIDAIAKQVVFLRQQGLEVVLVSSGAVAAGMSQLAIEKRPEKMSELQATAAVGQASLVRRYEEAFKPYDIAIAQILLTHADIANRERYLNARGTLNQLIKLGVLSVINENDSVATDEICFGDNDSLGALVANLISADLLVMLTDQDGLFTTDPRANANAKLLSQGSANDAVLATMASSGGELGRGGMVTKLGAAANASLSGADTIIANGATPEVLQKIFQGEEIGTLLVAKERIVSKKQWMAGQKKINGSLVIDQGAAAMLSSAGKSLLPVGVVDVMGDFGRGELVGCVTQNGTQIARGLSNYNSDEARKIIGASSAQINVILGYGGEDEIIHRDNLVLI